ncbi:macro domain containing protein [Megavirus baoshan]|uniref:Macro domain containing protein n=1 Tax=Megavirus baoshan TaxID=2496520 RepID=A0A3S8UY82_9VIRU|nr:macro domain containing protein [Megavirus baoshan]AZL89761.1 macro domain containing protein [Megavirus baoshan]
MNRQTIIFFDTNKDKINSYREILAKIKCNTNIMFKHCDFEELLENNILHAVVSPSNSQLSMTGGIDKTYADCFPNIEHKLRKICRKKKYEQCDIKSSGTNYIVPVGKCIVAATNNDNCPYIMAAPTMLTPQDINSTNNVYQAMRAILKKASGLNRSIIIGCPCLGTGIGNMDANISAKQVKRALLEN